MGALALPEPARGARRRPASSRSRPRASSSRRCGWPACSTTSGTGRSPTSSTTTSWPRSPRRPTRAGRPRKRLTHEDLSQLIIERRARAADRAACAGRRARSPSATRFADGEAIDPRWVSFLVSKPALADPAMPRWVRWLQPLLSGVFTVDNLDYVRRDAYLTGVAIGPVDVERLRRYTFISRARADAVRAGARRARDVPDRPPVHVPAGLLPPDGPGDRPRPRPRSSGRRSGRSSATARRPSGWPPTPTSTSTRCSTRPPAGRAARRRRRRRRDRAGRRARDAGGRRGWRAILLRRPRWRSEAEVRAEYEAGERPDDADRGARRRRARARRDRPRGGRRPAGRRDRRPTRCSRSRVATADRRCRCRPALASIPAYWLIGRRYRRATTGRADGAASRGSVRRRSADAGEMPASARAAGRAAGRSGRSRQRGSFIRLTTSGSIPNVAASRTG